MVDGALTHAWAIPFTDLGITAEKVVVAAGYPPGRAPTWMRELAAAILVEAPHRLTVRAGWRCLHGEPTDVRSHGFRLGDAFFATQTIVARGLRGADSMALFVATAGPSATAWQEELAAAGRVVASFFVDTLGTLTAEAAAQHVEHTVDAWARRRGWGTTRRYSPGYCGWRVAEQQQLFAMLPAQFCGVTLSDSSLMRPLKSISGVQGLGPRARKTAYECGACSMRACPRNGRAASRVPSTVREGGDAELGACRQASQGR